MATPRQLIDPPTFTPTPFGLLTTVDYPALDGPHWQNGVTYQPMCPGSSLGDTTYDECLAVTGTGAPPPPANLSGNISTTARGATSFVVYAEFDCPPIGSDAEAVASRAIQMVEAYQVERALWTGVAGGRSVVFPHLAANATVVDADGVLLQSAATDVGATGTGSPFVTGDLPNIGTAIGLLEQALAAAYNGVGIIHIPMLVLPTMGPLGKYTGGPTMLTSNGNKIAVGGGYPGTGPNGAARTGNACWIYATGNMFALRSPVRIRANGAAAFDRTNNTMRMIAERTYVLGWDCGHFAIQAALGVPKGT